VKEKGRSTPEKGKRTMRGRKSENENDLKKKEWFKRREKNRREREVV